MGDSQLSSDQSYGRSRIFHDGVQNGAFVSSAGAMQSIKTSLISYHRSENSFWRDLMAGSGKNLTDLTIFIKKTDYIPWQCHKD